MKKVNIIFQIIMYISWLAIKIIVAILIILIFDRNACYGLSF